MWTTLSSYIWGDEAEEQVVPELPVKIDDIRADDDWVLVDVSTYAKCDIKDAKHEDGQVPSLLEEWYVTPPPCFEAGGLSPQLLETNPLEDLLIEHPSMSVYGPRLRRQPSVPSSPSRSATPAPEDQDRNLCVARRQPRRTVNYQTQLELIQKRRQTELPTTRQPRPNKKKLKRQNHIHNQTKRCKKRDRMLGKHVGMHGKRGC